MTPPFANFRIIREISRGSRATVYKARMHAEQTILALKFYPDGVRAGPEVLRRAAELARIDCPRLVPVRGVVRDDGAGGVCVVMDNIEGEDLAVALARGDRFAPDQAFAIARQAAEGLAYAAEKGAHHGTLHPGHLLIAQGSVRVLGVGLGEALPEPCDPAALAGWAYASPEAAAGAPQSAGQDVFSLGAILFRVAAGAPPFRTGDLAQLKLDRIECAPRWPASPPPELADAVARMMDRDPARRPDWKSVVRMLTRGGRRAAGYAGPVVNGGASQGFFTRPVEDRPAAAPVRWPLWTVVGGAVAVAALAFAVMLRIFSEKPPPGDAVEQPAAPAVSGTAPQPNPVPVAHAPPTPVVQTPSTDPAAEWAAIEKYINDNPDWRKDPARRSAVEAELRKIARGPTSLFSIKANEMLAASAAPSGRDEAAHAVNALLTAADQAAREERFGDAMEKVKAARAAAGAYADLCGQTAAHYAALDAAADAAWRRYYETAVNLTALERYDEARQQFQRVNERFGLVRYRQMVTQALKQVDAAEERKQADAAAKARAERLMKIEADVRTQLPAIKSYVASFQYADALKRLDDLIDKCGKETGTIPEMLAAYRAVIAAESEALDKGFEAYNSGKVKKLVLQPDNPQFSYRIIEKMAKSELALEEPDGGVRTVKWDDPSITALLQLDILTKISDLNSAATHMALATWCWHHGMPEAAEAHFRDAVVRDGDLKAVRDRMTELLRQLGPYTTPPAGKP
jgi:eukaryotic-like serine/threonine-protein kinase